MLRRQKFELFVSYLCRYFVNTTMSSVKKMEIAKLRQPKAMAKDDMVNVKSSAASKKKKIPTDSSQVIVSLKNDSTKLVVPSDAYHAIVMADDKYRCLICEIEINVYDAQGKDAHRHSKKHALAIQRYPHLDEFGENLIRKIKENMYCTICNVIISKVFLNRHISSDMHKQELERAINKGAFYKPEV